jgi:hypothetical protein
MAARLEVLDRYDVASDGGDFARYLAGEDAPDPARKKPWLDELRRDTASGRVWRWVHVVRGPLSDYLRFGLEWGYIPNTEAGAQVRILDLAERPEPVGLIMDDFWLFDDGAVLVMHYDDDGRFTGAEPVEDNGRYRKALQVAWQAAEPVSAYWRSHPQYHRNLAA